jgi:hypothetical protein
MEYESMIDGTEFRTVLHYLTDPESPIEAVMHVRERHLLSELAQELEAVIAQEGDANAAEFKKILMNHMEKGNLLISTGFETDPIFLPYSIPVQAIPPSAWSEVLYLPGLYFAHTPGLFEGTLVSENPANEQQIAPQNTLKAGEAVKRGHSI